MSSAESAPAPPVSELLEGLRSAADTDRIALGDIGNAVHGRAHGLLLVLLALPEMVPMIGLSAILAAPIFVIGGSMLFYGADPPLPRWLRCRSIARSRIESSIERTRPLLRWLDRVSRPRWGTIARAGRLHGLACVILAVILAVPIPGVNILAAFGVGGIGLGILQRDGAVIAVALTLGALALLGATLVVTGAVAIFGDLVPGV